MPYALAADIHANNWSQFANLDNDGVNSRLKHVLAELQRLAENAASAECDRVYIAGDLFHVRGSIQTTVFNQVSHLLRETAEDYGFRRVIMDGNHDLEGPDSRAHKSAINSLECRGVKVVHEASHFDDVDKIVMVPWHRDRNLLSAEIERCAKLLGDDVSEYDLILHTGINGVLVGVPDNGWQPSELAAFGFKRVFAGHYHAHKVFEVARIGGFNENVQIVSIGALTHQTWSDVGTKAGWLIVDEHDFTFHENAQPKFRDFDLNDEAEDYTGDYVRVRGIDLDEDEIKQVRQILSDAGAAGVVVHAVPKSKVVTRDGSAASSGVTMESSITSWINSAALDDPARVESEALDILKEAQSV